MKIFFRSRLQVSLAVVVALLGITFVFSIRQGAASATIRPDECCRCHLEVCEQSGSKRYVHRPVLENKCAFCHVKGGMPAVAGQDGAAQPQDEIDWFSRDGQEQSEHWFELPASLAGTTLSVMANGSDHQTLEQEVTLPTLDRAEHFPGQHGGAKIFDLRVAEVKKGVFLSARIAWKTDRITDAQVFYGEGGLDFSTALDSRWSTDHEILVTGLDDARNYNFVAVSHDINGQEVRSPEMALSTRNFFSEPVLRGKGGLGQIAIQSRFYQEQERFFARFSSNHPVTLRLGRKGGQALPSELSGAQSTRPQDHLALTDPYALSVTVCLRCHPQSKGVLSHPVDVRPKAGMHIPADYRIMADGRLSCMSCHQAHASDHEYRLTRATRKDLCLGCHRNFG